jgi:hypothetical protein
VIDAAKMQRRKESARKLMQMRQSFEGAIIHLIWYVLGTLFLYFKLLKINEIYGGEGGFNLVSSQIL